METLLQLDREVLYLVNTRWANLLFDAIMPWLRLKYNWLPLYAVMIFALVYVYRKNVWVPLVVCIGAVAAADQIASGLLKPMFERLRPCQNSFIQVRDVIDCGGGYAFVSSHAANHFALAVSYAAFFRRARRWLLPVLLFWAGLICYAQVYVAYHFPSDVLVGGLMGVAVASVLLLLFKRKIQNLEIITSAPV